MSYVAKWFFRDGRTAHETAPFATRKDADNYAKTLNTAKGYTYTIEEVPDVSTAEVPNAKPSIGVMPRRIWEEQRIRALGEAIVRRMGREEPMVASVFDLAHIRDWAAEIVELCDRHGGQHPTTPRRSQTL